MLNVYELALVLHPGLDGAERDKLVELVEKIIKNFGGEISKREDGGKKPLAYPIGKQSDAWYHFLTVGLPGEAVNKLDTKLRVEEKVLRYLLIIKKQKNPSASLRVNSKTEERRNKKTKN